MCVNGKCVNLLRTYGCYCNRGYIFNKTTSRCDGEAGLDTSFVSKLDRYSMMHVACTSKTDKF